MNYPGNNEGKGFGIAALVLGIIALIISCIPPISLILSITGLTLAIVGLVKANKTFSPKTLIIAGLILSLLATLSGIAFGVYYYKQAKDNHLLDLLEEIKNYDSDDVYDINEEFEEMDQNFDSLKLDNDEIENLENKMDDVHNGPGTPPEEETN